MRGLFLCLTAAVAMAANVGCEVAPGGGDASGGDGDGGAQDGGDARETEFPDGAQNEACRKIDVIFAVDDSSSMDEEKAALRDEAFPAFAQALLDVGDGIDDFRVGVLDACAARADYHTRGESGECTFQGAQRWMESTSTALAAEFQCVGDVYGGDLTGYCTGSNDDEQPASAAAASLEAMWAGASAPNEGFSRTDALLVVVAITDEDEQPTPDATAQQVYDRLVAAKGGDVTRMVFLGIGGAQSCGSGAYGSADEAGKLRAITDLFIAEQRGVFYDLCLGQLETGFAQALTVIDEACDEFIPIP